MIDWAMGLEQRTVQKHELATLQRDNSLADAKLLS